MDFTKVLMKWLAAGPAAEANAAIVAELGRALGVLVSGGRAAPVPARKAAPVAKVARKIHRDMSCIATGCKERSKGPRFSYLCGKHEHAGKKEIETWRKMRAEAKAG